MIYMTYYFSVCSDTSSCKELTTGAKKLLLIFLPLIFQINLKKPNSISRRKHKQWLKSLEEITFFQCTSKLRTDSSEMLNRAYSFKFEAEDNLFRWWRIVYQYTAKPSKASSSFCCVSTKFIIFIGLICVMRIVNHSVFSHSFYWTIGRLFSVKNDLSHLLLLKHFPESVCQVCENCESVFFFRGHQWHFFEMLQLSVINLMWLKPRIESWITKEKQT